MIVQLRQVNEVGVVQVVVQTNAAWWASLQAVARAQGTTATKLVAEAVAGLVVGQASRKARRV